MAVTAAGLCGKNMDSLCTENRSSSLFGFLFTYGNRQKAPAGCRSLAVDGWRCRCLEGVGEAEPRSQGHPEHTINRIGVLVCVGLVFLGCRGFAGHVAHHVEGELDAAEELEALAQKQNKIVGITYGYAGHQAIEEARQLVAEGKLGKIRIIQLQFAHGFHNVAVEKNTASTKWRVNPKMAGPSYVLGDVGTHPLYLSEVICPDMKIKRLMCSRQSFVESRAPLEDNAMTIMEYDNGAIGYVWSSCVNCGSMHGQKVRIIGEKASIEWWDERPNQLTFEVQGEPVRILERGMGYLAPSALADDRIGGGHPEGLFEAWSNLYSRFAQAMVAADKGETVDFWYPNIHAGVEGVRWVENCVRSADNGATWVEYK